MNPRVIRALGPDEARAYETGRFVSLELQPYAASAAYALHPLAAEGLGTFAVDAAWRLYVDPELLVGANRWPATMVGGALLHEIWHLLRNHHDRAKALDPFDGDCWNLATDAAINEVLLTAGVVLPDQVVTPAGLGLPEGGIEEQYYAQLVQRTPGRPSGGLGGGCGSGAGLPGPMWEAPPGQAPVLGPCERGRVRASVAHAAQRHFSGRARGTMPESLRRWASRELAPPQVPWQEILAGAVRATVARAQGATDFDRRRPSRRCQDDEFLRPSLRGPRLSVAVVVDTSGSMGQAELDTAMAETAGIFTSAGVDRTRMTVVSCDAQAHVETYSGNESVKLVGGGGTDMRVGITAAAGLPSRPEVIVVLTDGHTPWPEVPTPARVIAVLIGRQASRVEPPPWMSTVRVREAVAA